MRLRFLALTAFLVITTAASAKEVWLSIGGTTAGGTFRTDARIFNPSTTKDIQIQAYYLPVGNTDNSAVQPLAPITVLKRQQVVYNDVVSRCFIAADSARSDSNPMTTSWPRSASMPSPPPARSANSSPASTRPAPRPRV